MDVKFGKIRPNNNLLLNLPVESSGDNFFASTNSEQNNQNTNENPSFSGGRINDYDSALLENNAYQTLPDELFKLEYKIGIVEEALDKINSEIAALEGLGYDIQLYDLKNRKQKFEQELAELNKKYSNFGISSKLSSRLSAAVSFASNGKKNVFSMARNIFYGKILSKISKKFCNKQLLKDALDSLGDINLSVDELIKMQVPYGENFDRYEKLTAYLNRANLIHSQISKSMNAQKDVKSK